MLKAELRALMDVRPNPSVATGLWIWNDKGQIVYIYGMSSYEFGLSNLFV